MDSPTTIVANRNQIVEIKDTRRTNYVVVFFAIIVKIHKTFASHSYRVQYTMAEIMIWYFPTIESELYSIHGIPRSSHTRSSHSCWQLRCLSSCKSQALFFSAANCIPRILFFVDDSLLHAPIFSDACNNPTTQTTRTNSKYTLNSLAFLLLFYEK